MAKKKVTVIGAGHVGEHVAFGVAMKELADVVLVDIVEGMPQGKALDMMQAGPILQYDVKIVGTNDYWETTGSDVMVITSGLPRKPGMSREELLEKNVNIVADVTKKAVEKSPDAIIIVVTNPLDAMTYTAFRVSGFPRERVMGMAGMLDSARFRTFIAMELGVSVKDVTAFVLGSHGDLMVPSTRYTTVAGTPVEKLIPKERLDAIVERTRKGGGEIVALLKTGSAYYAPAMGTVEMVESILKDKKQIIPCCVYCQGEYGYKDVFVGLPAKLGAGGVEEIVEFELTSDEKSALDKSMEHVKKLMQEVDSLNVF